MEPTAYPADAHVPGFRLGYGSPEHHEPEPVIDGKGGQFVIGVDIPHSYEFGDAMPIKYECQPQTSAQKAEWVTSVDVLSLLLVSAPRKVLLHPNSFKQGETSISMLRAEAEVVKAKYMSTLNDASTSSQPLAALVQHQNPRREPPVGIDREIIAPRAPAPAIGGEHLALVALGQLQKGVEYDPAWGASKINPQTDASVCLFGFG